VLTEILAIKIGYTNLVSIEARNDADQVVGTCPQISLELEPLIC